MPLGGTLAPSPLGSECPVCGSKSCASLPVADSAFTIDPRKPVTQPKRAGIIAQDRIWIDGRLAFAPGDPIPYTRAVELGLITEQVVIQAEVKRQDEAKVDTPAETAEQRAEARERRIEANRVRKAEEDRSA